MNMLYQKYREHEEQAEISAGQKDFAGAALHLKKAAAFAIELAKVATQELSVLYVRDANDKMDLAQTLEKRIKSDGGRAPDSPGSTSPSSTDRGTAVAGFIVKEKPTVRLADVVGMDELKKQLDEIIIKPYQYREKFKKAGLEGSGGGILLFGPPGTGKTYVARALAGELDVVFFNVDPSQLVDKYIGETGKNIAALFAEVRKHPRAIVFIDEVTQLLGENETTDKTGAIEQMFRETDGLTNSSSGFLLLMATNYPWKLPKPLLRQGRTRDIIYVGLPDRSARLSMLAFHARGRRLEAGIDLGRVADALEGYSAAEVAGVVRRAKEQSLFREIRCNHEDEPITAEDLSLALKSVRPASTAADIERYTAWAGKNFSAS